MSLDEIERIRRQNMAKDWSAAIIQEASIDDLDEAALKVARDKYIQKNSKFADEAETWDKKTFLNKAKLTINIEHSRGRC